MKKLVLTIDALRVESFKLSDTIPAAGTVRAHEAWFRATVTQCATGPCDCWLTDPSCNSPCD